MTQFSPKRFESGDKVEYHVVNTHTSYFEPLVTVTENVANPEELTQWIADLMNQEYDSITDSGKKFQTVS